MWSTRVAPGITLAVIIGTTVFTFLQLHPSLIFGPNEDVGGDNAAHIAAASFLIHHLLPRLQLTGWDPQWFGGFPLYVFYFPLPAVFIAILNPVFGYAVAFKIVTVLGTLMMPSAAYVFGRCSGFARPIPAVMSAAMIPFLFNTSYTIDGGNIASTLAGEFSFTLGMAFGLMFLGVLSYSIRTGRLRWLAALLFTATVLCHVVPAIVAGLAAIVLLLTHGLNRHAFRTIATVGVVGALLAAFWLFRFKSDLAYTSSMGYDKVTDPFGKAGLFPHDAELSIQILALVGAAIGVWLLHRVVLVLVGMAIGSAFAFVVLPSGLVYNGRWLPFWFLATALLAAYALGEIGKFLTGPINSFSGNEWLTPAIVCVAILLVVSGYLSLLPWQSNVTPANFVSGWASWNYSGYQAKQGWPEFQRIITMLDGVGAKYGCGNLDYEYSPNVNTYFGSTIVEMSFPFWTNGCIGSAEGLYYESSTSTPFHFLDQSEVSIQPSNPIPSLPYQPLDLADGIRHLELTGVKYFLANSPTVEAQAAADPDLTEIASTPAIPSEIDGVTSGSTGPVNPKWIVYAIGNSTLVTPLAYEPVVESGMSKSAWLAMALNWYQDEANWPVPIAMNGPSSWPRETPGTLVGPGNGVPLAKTMVSGIRTNLDSISFSVSRVGVPVLVKLPYFPNWRANGATGPYPVTPNLMVVVPTNHTVTLTYGTTTVDWVGRIGSALGIAGLLVLRTPTDPGPRRSESIGSGWRGSSDPENPLWWRDPPSRDSDEDQDEDGEARSPDSGDDAVDPFTGRPIHPRPAYFDAPFPADAGPKRKPDPRTTDSPDGDDEERAAPGPMSIDGVAVDAPPIPPPPGVE